MIPTNTRTIQHLEDLNLILDGCRKSDRKSQEVLYKKYYPAFSALCRNFFDDPHQILTALNNGMLKMYKNIHQYDASKGEFFNWAYTIIRHAALTLIRDQKKEVFYSIDHYEEQVQTQPFKHLEWKDIYHYLGKLTPNARCVTTLHYIDGLSIKEIAAAMEMKEGTVKWYLNESRTKLKNIFDQQNHLPKSA